MRLADFEALSIAHRESHASGLQGFLHAPAVVMLGWPADVVEQWLYDHAGYPPFQRDYGHIVLEGLAWRLETVPTATFLTMKTVLDTVPTFMLLACRFLLSAVKFLTDRLDTFFIVLMILLGYADLFF